MRDLDRRAFVQLTARGAAFSLLGLALGSTACSRREQGPGNVDEALEELREGAMDAKDELEDEIDDHT